MTNKPTIGFAGMTHLGLIMASAVASRGFGTVCYDQDASLVERLKGGGLPVNEPGLDDLIRQNGARQHFSADPAALTDCDVVYISVDVPTDDTGRSDLSTIRAMIDRVAGVLAPHAYMVILCQVPPGFTRSVSSVPHDRLYYQVETLVFGRAVERALRPERYIVGSPNPEFPLPLPLATLLGAFGCPLLVMRYESAELAKIAINCCLVASVSVANTLAELSEATGADWSEIVPALRLDERIGPKAYLSPGLGIAGGNLERDLTTVVDLAERSGTDSGVIRAFIANSRHRAGWARAEARRVLAGTGGRIAIWGLAYKENTHSIKNSPSLATIAGLQDIPLTVHDPVVPASVVDHPRVKHAETPLDALEGADLLLIMTPWAQYRGIAPAEIAARMAGKVVIDPFRVLGGSEAAAAGLDYRTLGVSK
ncbi:nucleotide sugar dehydrogenase [Ferrovibrio xuzhouensis]|uniref:UDP-glucose 6-dehydrogenase n=1 Tax=Ferrovibrio xuzhouensis TaxID=1576914 RepID=A0ABV7VBL2_9PROT